MLCLTKPPPTTTTRDDWGQWLWLIIHSDDWIVIFICTFLPLDRSGRPPAPVLVGADRSGRAGGGRGVGPGDRWDR